MSAANHNLTISRGEDLSFTLTLKDVDGETIDVSSDTFPAEIRRDGGKPLVAEFVSDPTSNGASGQVTFTLPKSESLKLDGNNRYKWDLFRVQQNEITTRLIYGSVNVENNITLV